MLLIACALALDPDDPAVRAWFVAALVLSLAGDVFLMLPQDLFVFGLGSFLLGHIAYIVGMHVDGVDGLRFLVGIVSWWSLLAVIGTRDPARRPGRARPGARRARWSPTCA